MSFTLTFGQEGNCATAQVVWSVNGETYNFRSDNNFVAWISTIFTVADVVAGGGGVTNPLVLPDNTNANGWSLNTLDFGGVGGSITMIGNVGGIASGSINLSAGLFIDATPGAGGSINLQGGAGDGATAGSAGSINLSGGNDGCSGGSLISTAGVGSGALGGNLNMSGGSDSNGGSIITIGGSADNDGGSINTSGGNDGPGGSINTSAGEGGPGGSINTSNNGGSIDLRGGSLDGGVGGSIDLRGGSLEGGSGGSINTSGYSDDSTLIGGSINTSAKEGGPGGSINTSAGGSGAGGSINTSNGGGSINTTGVGSIGFGVSGFRTTVVGSATADQTQTLANATGTIPAILSSAPSITFGAIGGNGAVVENSQTITGAGVGDAVLVTCTTNRTTLTAGATSNIVFDGLVTATNTVSVRAHNPHSNSITLGALNFRILIFKGV